MQKKFKRILAFILALFMAFGILPWRIIAPDIVLAATGFRHESVGGADVVLGGNYIEVGISQGGSFGTANPAPAGFHPSPNPYYQLSDGVGLRVDGDGFDTGNAPTTGDFFLPGTPEEGFTVGYKINSDSAVATIYTNAERTTGDDIPTVTNDTTSGDTLSAATFGTTVDNNLAIQQKVSFKVNDKFFKTVITYTNNGSNTLYDVRYMRSFDPDQDADLYGVYETYNSVLENFPQDSRAIVRAEGGQTKEPIFFITTDSRARASAPINGLYNRDPYDPSVYDTDGSLLKTSEVFEDEPIALTFALGTLAPGQSTTFEYYTSLDPDYNSGLSAIMGLVGLHINNGASETNSQNVTLNLDCSNVSQMCFSNDNTTFTDWEAYTYTKAWTLTSGKGTKTVYAKFKDDSGNISQQSTSINFNNLPQVSDGSLSVMYQTQYNFAANDFTSDGKFSDPDGDTLQQIKITALPVHGVLELSGSSISLNQTITYSDLSKITYIPNNGYYGPDAFKWTASDGSDFSAAEASMNITVQALPPSAPGVFTFPAEGQVFKGGDSINTSWGAVTSPSGATVTYALDYFNGSTWSNVYTGTSTSYNFLDTSGKNLNTAEFRVKASDSNGSSGYTLSNTFTIDSQAPSITNIEQTPSAWTSSSVKLTVDANDGMSGLADKPYSFDGGKTWQADNTETYDADTSGIVVEVKDKAGNIATYNAEDITNIDNTPPNAPVITDADNYTGSKWYNSDQTITAGFTTTEGCDEKLQYMVDNGAWTDGEQVTIADEGKHNVSFRVIDSLDRTGTVQSVKVNVDKTAPENAKITVKDNGFTSFLNKITFGLFFNDTVDVSITADCDISGTNKIEYQKVSDESDYSPDGTWTSGSSFSISPDDKCIIYARITDNAGNYVIINTDGIIVDASKPGLDLKPGTDGWSSYNIDVAVTAMDALAGIKKVTYTTDESVPQTGTVALTDGKGTITLTHEGQYKLTVTAEDNSLNETTETADIKIDKSLPVINSVTGNPTDWTSNSVKLTADAKDEVSGLADKPYSFDGGKTWQADNFKIYDANTSGIVIEIKDSAGNTAAYSPIDITKIDKTQPNAPVITDADNYTDSKWYNSDQTIKADFTRTDGCDEKLQYMVDNGAWTDGKQVRIADEGKHNVSFRVIDSLNRTGSVQSVKVNIDSVNPTVPGVQASSDNSAYTGAWTAKDILVKASGSNALSGINHYEYKAGAGGQWKTMTQTSGAAGSFTRDTLKDETLINQNIAATYYIRAVSNSGIVSGENSIVIRRDNSVPETNVTISKGTAGTWTKNPVTFTVANSNRQNLAPVSFYVKTGSADWVKLSVNSCTFSNEMNQRVQFKTVTAAGLENVSQTSYSVQIDKTNPIISGAEDSKAYYIGRIINIKDTWGQTESSVYTKDGGKEVWFSDGNLISDPGKYNIIVTDKAGNKSSLSFTINALPDVSDIKYTDDSKALIKKIMDEFNGHSDLPEPYRTDTGNAIKLLESRYSGLSLLKLYNKPNDVTVTGINGTVFGPDTYLVVTPITSDSNNTAISFAKDKLSEAGKTNSELEKKDLLALYDVSLFRDKVKIEPDGKVQVRIKIPAQYANRTGLDIVHIADDGTITVMHATRDGDYLVFTTDHFSQYVIIAKNTCWLGICNALGIYEKDGGVCYCWAFVLGAAVILAGTAAFIIYKKRKRRQS